MKAAQFCNKEVIIFLLKIEKIDPTIKNSVIII
jgi:hypothetical protein